MAGGFLDMDLDFPKGEIPSTCIQVLNVYKVDEENKKGYLLDIEIPKKDGKKGNVTFLAFYPRIKRNFEEVFALGTLLSAGAMMVKVSKKKEVLFKLNYFWDGGEFMPAPLSRF